MSIATTAWDRSRNACFGVINRQVIRRRDVCFHQVRTWSATSACCTEKRHPAANFAHGRVTCVSTCDGGNWRGNYQRAGLPSFISSATSRNSDRRAHLAKVYPFSDVCPTFRNRGWVHAHDDGSSGAGEHCVTKMAANSNRADFSSKVETK